MNPMAPEDQFPLAGQTLTPLPPGGGEPEIGFRALLDQLFGHQFPAHPVFDAGSGRRW